MEVRQLIVIRISSIVLMIACLFSCGNNTNSVEFNETKNTQEIIEYLIDQFTKPIPRPPKSLSDSTSQISNFENKILMVGINPTMKPISLEYSDRIKQVLKSIDSTIKIDHNQKRNLEINLQELNKSEEYRISHYVNDDENDVFDTIDILYNFSTINFNQDHTKAVLILGMSRGKLNGFADIIILEKIKGEWQIIHRKNLVIS